MQRLTLHRSLATKYYQKNFEEFASLKVNKNSMFLDYLRDIKKELDDYNVISKDAKIRKKAFVKKKRLQK